MRNHPAEADFSRGLPETALPDPGGWVLRVASQNSDSLRYARSQPILFRRHLGYLAQSGRGETGMLLHSHHRTERTGRALSQSHAAYPPCDRLRYVAEPVEHVGNLAISSAHARRST